MSHPKVIIVFSVVVLLFMGTIGIGYSGIMMGHEDMMGCSLMGHSAVACKMNPIEHLSVWQTMFSAVFVQSVTLALLLLIAIVYVAQRLCAPQLLRSRPHQVRFLYDPESVSYDALRRFMARGLMHPKLF